MTTENTRKITPEKALGILQKHGLKVTLEQARIILDFLYKLAHVAVNSYLSKE